MTRFGCVLGPFPSTPSHINPTRAIPARPRRNANLGEHKACPDTSAAAGGMRKRFSSAGKGNQPCCLRPGSLPASPGAPEQPQPEFPGRNPRQDPARVDGEAHGAQSVSWAGPSPAAKALLAAISTATSGI